jgi:hypothetical protein
MKLTSRDFRSLRQAADVADAQKELVELLKRRSENSPSGPNWRVDAGVIAVALALILGITIASVTQGLDYESQVYEGAARQHVVALE